MSRKELHQPDRIQVWLYAVANFIFKNSRWFIASGVIVILGMIGTFLGIQYAQNEQIAQTNQFYESQKILRQIKPNENDRKKEALVSFENFLKSYPDQTNSVTALMEMGKIYSDQKDWENSEKMYQKVIDHPKATLGIVNLAKLNMGVIYENQQQWDRASLTIESLMGDDWQDLKYKSLARIAIANGQLDQAKKNLEQLIEKTPESIFKQEAETALLTLKQ